MKKGTLLMVLSFLLIAPFASAEIMMSQPASAYSYGDVMNVTISLIPQADINDFLAVKLICDGNEAEIHKAVYDIKSNERKEVYLLAKLDSAILADIQGSCLLKASYSTEEKESQYFIISKGIDVIANVEGSFFEPGNSFGVSGRAIKTNGQALSGYVEVKSDSLNVASSGSVANGDFKLNLTIPDNANPGNYDINVRVYEKDTAGAVANEGATSVGLRVKQIAKGADVALGAPSIKPGNDYSYSAVLLDQAGGDMSDDVTMSVYTPSGELFSKSVVSAGQVQTLKIEKNFEPGYWKIIVERGDIKSEKSFYVEELMEASFMVENGTLTVTNVGNVPYTKAIEIVIGDTGEVKELDIPAGEFRKFLLYAPDGDYSIKIKDGQTSTEVGRSYLTGSTIAVKEDTLIAAGKISLIVWIFLILITGAFAFVKYKKVQKKTYVGFTPNMVRFVKSNDKFVPVADPSEDNVNGREECTIVVLKVKNFDALKNSEGTAPETLSRIMKAAKDMKAKISSQEGINSAVFIPSITKSENNIIVGAKFAKEAERILNDHNRKYGQKIDFGLGVNKGEMILEPGMNGLKVTSVGNVTLLARKLAELAEGNVLISGEAYRKAMNVIRAERLADKGAYKINNIIDRERHSGFIDNFMKRQN